MPTTKRRHEAAVPVYTVYGSWLSSYRVLENSVRQALFKTRVQLKRLKTTKAMFLIATQRL